MKIRVEVDKSCPEDEIIIRCAQRNDAIERMYGELQELSRMQETIPSYKDHAECFVLSRPPCSSLRRTAVRCMPIRPRMSTVPTNGCMNWKSCCPRASCASPNRPFSTCSRSAPWSARCLPHVRSPLPIPTNRSMHRGATTLLCAIVWKKEGQPYEKRTHFLGIVFPFGSRARHPQPILAVRGDLARSGCSSPSPWSSGCYSRSFTAA